MLCIGAVLMFFMGLAHAEKLTEAVATGKVIANFEAIGGSSGDVIAVTVRLLGNDVPDIKLTVPAGTRLKSRNMEEQDMYLAGLKGILISGDSYNPTSSIEVRDVPTTYVLEAYCADFDKENPSPGGGYVLGAVDVVAECILSQGKELAPRTKQAAVWIHTDRATYAQVREKFRLSQKDWKAAEVVVKKCH